MNQEKQKISLKDIDKFTKIYSDIYGELLSKIEELENIQHGFPVKVSKDFAYDDLTLQAANCKHKSLTLIRMCLTASGSAEIDYKYAQSFILLEKADEILKDKGFDRLTDSLRQAAMASSDELRRFSKVVVDIKALEETCTRLFKAFESDEVNFRKIYDKNEFKGF